VPKAQGSGPGPAVADPGQYPCRVHTRCPLCAVTPWAGGQSLGQRAGSRGRRRGLGAEGGSGWQRALGSLGFRAVWGAHCVAPTAAAASSFARSGASPPLGKIPLRLPCLPCSVGQGHSLLKKLSQQCRLVRASPAVLCQDALNRRPEPVPSGTSLPPVPAFGMRHRPHCRTSGQEMPCCTVKPHLVPLLCLFYPCHGIPSASF